MSDNYVDRDRAEDIIKQAIKDFLPDETLQEILDLIYGSEFIIIDDVFREQMEENDEE